MTTFKPSAFTTDIGRCLHADVLDGIPQGRVERRLDAEQIGAAVCTDTVRQSTRGPAGHGLEALDGRGAEGCVQCYTGGLAFCLGNDVKWQLGHDRPSECTCVVSNVISFLE